MCKKTVVKAPDPDDFGKDVEIAKFSGSREKVGTKSPKPFLFPIKRLLYSRKFMVLLLDVIISTILYFVGKYSVASIADDIGFLIAAYQPVALMMIYTIAQEDAALIHRDRL